MASNTHSLRKIVSMLRDLSIRHNMVNDFFYGQLYDIGTERPMKFPYIAVQNSTHTLVKSQNGYKEGLYSFDVLCVDKINKGEDNYQDILSDTHFILDGIVQDLAQHQYWRDLQLQLVNDIVYEEVIDATDDRSYGWRINITLKQPIRFTPCNSPIEPITDWSVRYNESLVDYRLVGATGPAGPTGPAGYILIDGGFANSTYGGVPNIDGGTSSTTYS